VASLTARLIAVACCAGLVLTAVAAPAALAGVSAPATSVRPSVEMPLVGDDHPGLMEQRRRDARDTAIHEVLAGRATPAADGTVVKLPGAGEATSPPTTAPPFATSSYAEVAVTGTDQVLTLLVDFGPGDYRDRTWNGPVHGQLRGGDSGGASGGGTATYGLPDSDVADYEALLAGADRSSLASYLADQSGGRYTIDATVRDWVGVPYNAAHYGADDCDANECPARVAEFVTDAVDAFVADFYARDPLGDLAAFLEPYDQRDRYDGDDDGDFAESDGYVDRLMLVFAGAGQGAGADSDALRSQFGSVAGASVGASGLAPKPLGGHELGTSGHWVDAFSVVPENVGLGTLVHTYGHDLGLADLADPAGSATIDSSVQFWSPMAAGAGLSAAAGEPAERGTTAPDLLAAERLQLGWLDYELVDHTTATTLQLTSTVAGAPPTAGAPAVDPPPGQVESGAESGTDAGTDAGVVALGELPYSTPTTAPATGERVFAAPLAAASTATLIVPLRGDEARASWRQWTDTEPLFDAVHVQARNVGVWRDIAPVTSGRSDWVTRSASLPDGADALRFTYSTDHVSTRAGVIIDDITIGAGPADSAELGIPPGWTAAGWTASDGVAHATAPGFYLAERRDLSGYDAVLGTGPYVADPRSGTSAVDRFRYDDGVLVTFWDGRAVDNDVTAHPGSGRLLVVDARPTALAAESGAPGPLGLAPFDAAFGTSWRRGLAVDAYAVAATGEITADRVRVRAQAPVPTFDDTDPRYALGGAGQPRLPAVGVRMTVIAEDEASTTVQFSPAPAGR